MILLIGGTGYIGLKFQEILSRRNLNYLNLSRRNIDYITTEQVADMINDMLNLDREFKYWLSDSHFYGQAATTLRSSCVMDNTKLLSTGIHMRTGVEALEASLTNWIK